MSEPFWRTDPNAQFATLIRVARRHCHPEAYEEAHDDLVWLARQPPDEEMCTFKKELKAALSDPAQLPQSVLGDAVQFSDGSDEQFLGRLWRDLYGAEQP